MPTASSPAGFQMQTGPQHFLGTSPSPRVQGTPGLTTLPTLRSAHPGVPAKSLGHVPPLGSPGLLPGGATAVCSAQLQFDGGVSPQPLGRTAFCCDPAAGTTAVLAWVLNKEGGKTSAWKGAMWIRP